MTDRREAAALLALARSGKRHWHAWAQMAEEAGSALAVAEGAAVDSHEEPDALFAAPRAPVVGEAAIEEALVDLEAWADEGLRVVTVLDDEYPANLRTIFNRPPFLFIAGELVEGDTRSVAVVGTRKATDAGLERATEMSRDLVERGLTVISGLAEGVDTAAHRAALAAGGRTVAVVGTGLRRYYPAKNADLQRRLASEAAVVSQFWPDSPPRKQSFPMRNITMSGLALATVVIEASDTSGARMQARFALEHGRPVFLIRSLVEGHAWAREYVRRPGTYVIDGASEVLDVLDRLSVAELTALRG